MSIERTIDAATLAAISDPAGFYPIVLFFVDWPGSPVYAHTNLGALSWDGQTWNGVGNVGQVSLPGDTYGMAQQEASLALLGLGDELDDYLDVDARDREARVYFGAVTERDGATLIGEPFEVFSGTINGLNDMTQATDEGRSRGVQVPLASGPSQRAKAGVYHSFQDQSSRFLGDTAGRLLINSEREGQRHRWPE